MGDAILISAAEPPSLRALGEFSPFCEQLGADFLLLGKRGLCAVQRKELSDLVASLRSSDRIAREMAALVGDAVAQAVLLIEGQPRWGRNGLPLAYPHLKFTRAEYRGVVMSVCQLGIWVIETTGLEDTAATLLQLETFFAKDSHHSLFVRPKPRRASTPQRDAGIHMLQAIPGIGYKQAASIYDHFRRVPVRLDCTKDELGVIRGLGPVRIESIIQTVGGWNGHSA